jgi:putative ABC transport system permease protein
VTLQDISINNLRSRKNNLFSLILGLTNSIRKVVTLLSVPSMVYEDISNKLEELGANVLIVPRLEDLCLSYGGLNLGGVAVGTQVLKHPDVQRIR